MLAEYLFRAEQPRRLDDQLELEEFFVNYHKLSGEQYRVIDVRGPGQARKRIGEGMRAALRG